jgi:hypothetical protein
MLHTMEESPSGMCNCAAITRSCDTLIADCPCSSREYKDCEI